MNNKQTLHGLRVLNTRPKAQAHALSSLLERQGAIVTELPMLNITPIETNGFKDFPPLSHYQQAIFISPNAVSYFFNQLPPNAWPPTVKTIAIGPGTADTLIKYHISIDTMPSEYNSQGLLALPTLNDVQGQAILLIKGIGGLTLITDTLNARGASVTELPIYLRDAPTINLKRIDDLWRRDAIDMIVITSQEALDNLFLSFGIEKRTWLCSKLFLVLSTRLVKAATDYGIKAVISSRYDSLLSTLEAYIHDK